MITATGARALRGKEGYLEYAEFMVRHVAAQGQDNVVLGAPVQDETEIMVALRALGFEIEIVPPEVGSCLRVSW